MEKELTERSSLTLSKEKQELLDSIDEKFLIESLERRILGRRLEEAVTVTKKLSELFASFEESGLSTKDYLHVSLSRIISEVFNCAPNIKEATTLIENILNSKIKEHKERSDLPKNKEQS